MKKVVVDLRGIDQHHLLFFHLPLDEDEEDPLPELLELDEEPLPFPELLELEELELLLPFFFLPGAASVMPWLATIMMTTTSCKSNKMIVIICP
jgi:hypothetical protein